MPRRRTDQVKPEDFRTPAERRADRALGGVLYRCRAHGLTDEPVILGGVPYCPREDCEARVLLAASPIFGRTERRTWNGSGFTR